MSSLGIYVCYKTHYRVHYKMDCISGMNVVFIPENEGGQRRINICAGFLKAEHGGWIK